MRHQLYYLVRKIFGQEQRNNLKTLKYKWEKKTSNLRKKIYGTFDAPKLQNHLKTVLPNDFEVMMVHCSHHEMLPYFKGSLTELMQIFLDFCGPERTLVMPAFFLGDRRYHYNTLKYYQDRGEFDVYKAPSQMGMLSEVFRRYPGVVVSAHPTHRISALGPLANELVADHERCRTGCGAGSPFDKMARLNTLVVGSGIRYYQCMTQTHSPEDVLIETGEYPTKFELNTVEVKLKLKDDEVYNHVLTLPDKGPYERKLHPQLRRMLNQNDLKEWKFHGVPFFHANASRVQEVLIEHAHEGHSVYF